MSCILRPRVTKFCNKAPQQPREEYLLKKLEKGENAVNKHFLHFQKCLLPSPKQISFFSHAYFNHPLVLSCSLL